MVQGFNMSQKSIPSSIDILKAFLEAEPTTWHNYLIVLFHDVNLGAWLSLRVQWINDLPHVLCSVLVLCNARKSLLMNPHFSRSKFVSAPFSLFFKFLYLVRWWINSMSAIDWITVCLSGGLLFLAFACTMMSRSYHLYLPYSLLVSLLPSVLTRLAFTAFSIKNAFYL